MIRGTWARYGLALVISIWLAGPLLVTAQPTSLAPNVIAPSRETSAIRNQLTMARKLEQQALHGIMAIPADNSTPVDATSLQAARDAYVLMRAARHGLNWQREARKFPDPILDMVYKRVEDAWNLSRTPVDRTGYEPAAYAQVSVRDMTQAIRLLDQALALLQ
jgi:hypothetical protein